MEIKHGSTKVFLCVYIIISTFLVTAIIRSFNASLEEKRQLKAFEKRLKRMQYIHLLYTNSAASAPSSQFSTDALSERNAALSISPHQLLLDILIYSGKLDLMNDVDPWLRVSVVH